jgi:hypothetical protein
MRESKLESEDMDRRAPSEGRRHVVQRWTRFVVGLLVVFAFAFLVLPWLQGLGPARALREFILKHDIEATGLFYTEVEQCTEAERYVRDSLRHAGVQE